MKEILLILTIDDEGYKEEEIIQNILKSIPNRIKISMREVIDYGEVEK
jgi:hypothetical protein